MELLFDKSKHLYANDLHAMYDFALKELLKGHIEPKYKERIAFSCIHEHKNTDLVRQLHASGLLDINA